jgi:hypothetical protein
MKFFLIISYIKQGSSVKAQAARKNRRNNVLKIQDVERRLFELEMTLKADQSVQELMKESVTCNSYPGFVACHRKGTSLLYSTQTGPWKLCARVRHPGKSSLNRWTHQLLDSVEPI